MTLTTARVKLAAWDEAHNGAWVYELVPAERDLATAMDTRFPDVNYWGFRQRFNPTVVGGSPVLGLVDESPWVFDLVYD